MNSNKQILLINILLGTPDLFALVTPIIQPRYFDPEFRGLMTFVMDYQHQFKGIPTPEVISAEVGVDVQPQAVDGDLFRYACNEFEGFCKRRALDFAIRDSVALIEKEDYGTIEKLVRNAITTSITRNLGTDVFDNPLEILNRTEKNVGVPISTGWLALDQTIGGGIFRKDLIIFSANSGGGKSICMDNLAANLHNQNLHGVYFSFELSEDMLIKRHYSIMTEIDAPQVFARKIEVAAKVEQAAETNGGFIFVRMPGGTKPSAIRAYLKEYQLKYGRVPDFMVFDYMSLMGTDENIPMSDTFTRDKVISEALREIGNDFDAIIITASQQNRSAVGAVDVNHSHIAGGISKIDTCDLAISIVFTDAMRASGDISLQLLKTRSSDGVGKSVQLRWMANCLKIVDPDDIANSVRLKHQMGTRTDSLLVDNTPRKVSNVPSSLAELIGELD